MSRLAHLITGTVSAAVAIVVTAGWQHFRPAPSMAKVDIIGIVTLQQQKLAAQMKPGMDQKAQADIIESASRFGTQLEAAMTQVSRECNCTLINAAAIVKDAPAGLMRDYTQRVTELATGKK